MVFLPFTHMNPVLDEESSPECIELLIFDVAWQIYLRMNETFSVSKSFFWRRRHHDNNVASLLKLHSCFLQSSQISLFSLTALVSLKFNKSKNHKNISTFHLFTHVHAGANCVNQNSHLFFSILSFFYIKE